MEPNKTVGVTMLVCVYCGPFQVIILNGLYWGPNVLNRSKLLPNTLILWIHPFSKGPGL